MSEMNILAMEAIIVEHAGPMGKFVIKKAIADLGISPTAQDRESANKLIDTVLKRCIFDTGKWGSVKKQILMAWGM